MLEKYVFVEPKKVNVFFDCIPDNDNEALMRLSSAYIIFNCPTSECAEKYDVMTCQPPE